MHARLPVLALLLAPAAACRSEPVLLRLALEPGSARDVAMVVEQTARQDWGGGETRTTQHLRVVWRQEVLEVADDGTAVVGLTWESARLALDGPELGHLEYDSDRRDEGVPPFALGLDAMLGERMRLTITPTGEIVSTDVERLIDRVLARLALPPGERSDAIRGGLRHRFGDDAVREMLQATVSIYPDGPVVVGDRWRRDLTVTRGYPHTQRNTYELTGVSDELLTVRVRSKLESLPDARLPGSGPVTTAVDVRGTQTGVLRLDRATGMVLVAELQQRLRGDVVLTMAGTEPSRSRVEITGRIELAVGD